MCKCSLFDTCTEGPVFPSFGKWIPAVKSFMILQEIPQSPTSVALIFAGKLKDSR